MFIYFYIVILSVFLLVIYSSGFMFVVVSCYCCLFLCCVIAISFNNLLTENIKILLRGLISCGMARRTT